MQNLLIKLLEPKTNGPQMAEVLISLLNVKISNSTLVKEIEEHPNYPSLLSISDILTTYGVDNIGIKFDIAKIASLPLPFITQLQGQKSFDLFFTVVKEVKTNTVVLYDPEKHKWTDISFEEFREKCSRVALLVEAEDGAGESDYKIKRKEEKKKEIIDYAKIFSIPAIFAIAVITTFINNGWNALFSVIYCAVTLVGTGIAALLVLYELDIYNPLLQQICSSGKKVNCGTVLRSKGAKIFGISWSSIGFSYFMGLLLLLLFTGINNIATLYLSSLITSITVFYVIFSIFYQWRVAKQWCVLCLCVQAILMLQFILVSSARWQNLSISYDSVQHLMLPALTAFTIPFLVTQIVIPALQKAKESKRNYNELQKLKHNKQVFETILKKQKQLTEHPVGLGIFLGNENASHKLIKVCNPYCGPCSRAHKPMEELLENNPDVQIQILFTASNNEGDIKTPPVKHLMAIAEKNDETIVKKALDDWYLAETKDYDSFALKYPMNGELEKQEEKIVVMKDWCDKAVIAYTPMFFVSFKEENEDQMSYYQLPEIYNVADLKYFFSS